MIAKYPIDPRSWWRDRCRHEIGIYQAWQRIGQPPVLVPYLVAADLHLPLLVLTELPGSPLRPERYPPADTVSMATTQRMLAALTALHRWRPTAPCDIPDDTDYPAQLAPFAGDVLETNTIRELIQLHDLARTQVEVSHGDAHLGNTSLIGRQIALLDFEFTAWRPAGYDHAKLYLFLSENPAARHAVKRDVDSAPAAQAGFWISVALAACREMTSHRQHADLPDREQRLYQIATDLRLAVTECRRIRAQIQ
ncbi:phosphotransferase [Micromonospora sp. Llam0]|uniref:phosphotransferase n=1 Tax=Micromonospora sp. Llam0 TaxID=2485143 RepID=UPI0011CE8EAB|nr:phosphotransferase [Micromonospora sp. Llam0]